VSSDGVTGRSLEVLAARDRVHAASA
jgi:hypothetical protein